MNDNYISISSLITDNKGRRSIIRYYRSINTVNYVFVYHPTKDQQEMYLFGGKHGTSARK
jgi:hypothetical protein